MAVINKNALVLLDLGGIAGEGLVQVKVSVTTLARRVHANLELLEVPPPEAEVRAVVSVLISWESV